MVSVCTKVTSYTYPALQQVYQEGPLISPLPQRGGKKEAADSKVKKSKKKKKYRRGRQKKLTVSKSLVHRGKALADRN